MHDRGSRVIVASASGIFFALMFRLTPHEYGSLPIFWFPLSKADYTSWLIEPTNYFTRLRRGALIAMAEPDPASENVAEYLKQLTPQVRSRLLAELERLNLLGESVPNAEALIVALRAEFRDTGQTHYRIGNPSRYFFEPLEPVLVNGAPERANSGQIARGSLAPIWSLISEKLLPSMAADYVANAKKVIVANDRGEAQRIAAAFRKKVLTYLNGVLGSADGIATVRSGLEAYTSSRAIFDELMKTLRLMHAQEALAEFSDRLPPKIKALDSDSLTKVLGLLDALRTKHADVVPFALTITANRLETPWHLICLATRVAGSKAVSKIAATPYAIAVPMVIDKIDEKRLMLLDAFRHNRIPAGKQILDEIYAIEEAVRARVALDGSDWGNRLQGLMASIKAALETEISSLPTDQGHLTHVLASSRQRPTHSLRGRLGDMMRKGRDAVTEMLPG